MAGLVWLLVTAGVAAQVSEQARPLNHFIRHYEPVEYDESQLIWDHHRFRRSFIGLRAVPLKFTAFGRTFDLLLTPEERLFHDHFTLLVDEKPLKNHGHVTNIYSGYDKNDPTSRVHGNLVEGIFDGSIRSDGEVYQVEPASRYAEDLDSSHSAHSIIYRHSDLDTSSVTGASCGATNQALQSRLIELQRSALRRGVEGEREAGRRLFKRQQRDTSKIRCWLHITADYKFVSAHTSGSESRRTAQAVALIARYVSDTNSYYKSTDFDGDGSPDNIHFGIEFLHIELTPPSSGPFVRSNIGVVSFLDFHSMADYSAYCLAYRFTHRDFDHGVLGLAYVAAQPPSTAVGGICEDITTFSDGSKKSLNTGIVTTLNFNSVVPTAVTSVTFAHEAGHNFGAEHDPEDRLECVPTTKGGKYIMYAFANDGSQSNNLQFSPCSIEMMNNVIGFVAQGPDGCFVEATSECGNSVIDLGEECDCGSQGDTATGDCPTDPCCNATSCLSSTDVECSPGGGINICCNSSCQFIPTSANMVCSEETICANEQTCLGNSAGCPPSVPKTPPVDPGYIVCNNQTQLLCNTDTGVCNATVCAALDMGSGPLDSCECSSLTEACHICCRLPSGVCVSTVTLASGNDTIKNQLPYGMGAVRMVGFPCLQFTGYCDFFDNCAIIESDGALNQLANVLSSQLFNFLSALKNWWAILAVVAGVVLLVCCMFTIVLVMHLILPRPQHAKYRDERRKTRWNYNRVHPTGGYPMGSYKGSHYRS